MEQVSTNCDKIRFMTRPIVQQLYALVTASYLKAYIQWATAIKHDH